MNRNPKKKEPWRIIVFLLAIAFIAFLWIKKDIAAIYSTVSSERVAPLIATTVAVSLLKVAVITGIVLLARWLIGKLTKK